MQKLRSIVIYSLDNDSLSSAEFAAEKLLAETGSDDHGSIHLYALVLFKKNRIKTAFNLTANIQHPGCSYVFAQAALALSLGQEGIYSLLSTQHLWDSLPDSLSTNYEFERKLIPDPAAFYCLLGKLYHLMGDNKESAINHSKALKRNPFIWESFEELNKIGANVRVKAIYKVVSDVTFGLNNADMLRTEFNSRDPFGDSSNINKVLNHKTFINTIDEASRSHEPSPDFQTPRMKQPTLPNAPTRRTRSSSITSTNGPAATISREVFKQPPLININDSTKRPSRLTASKVTSRLISQPLSSKTPANRNSSFSEFTHKKSNKLSGPDSNIKKREYLTNEDLGDEHIRNIYSVYAKGLKAMSRYDSFKAIRILTSLPESHANTPWVLSKLGRLHFEIVNYEESELYFKKLRKLDLTRLEDIEYYSTLLWHLHKDVDLCHLAHDLLDIDRNSPQTWVTIGNLFSLTREPDEAIKCFQRSTQLDQNFAYAYTLQGHEYVANDAYENALESFRNALLIDSRHYNALYGIGMVYLKLGNFTKAEFHFRKAVDINPVNVILICCVGMMLEKLGKKDKALHQYELACKIQPLSALALFKKAQLLFSLEEYHAALIDFEYLATIAPDEASVHFLLGQLYKLANRKEDAIRRFTVALNLDPKGNHLVKEALESLAE